MFYTHILSIIRIVYYLPARWQAGRPRPTAGGQEGVIKPMSTILFKIFASAVILAIAYFVGQILRIVLTKHLAKWAAKTTWKWDDPIIESLRRPMVLWYLLGGLYFVKEQWALPPAGDNLVNKALIVMLGISVIMVLANLVSQLLGLYADKVHQVLPLTNLTRSLLKIMIITIGGLMVLNALGVSITPLLTTLGIAGLAVALALQDTLANIFAGFYITMSRDIKKGDFVKLETGEQGYVNEIGWRATSVRMLPNNMVIIPNSKLAQSVMTNFYQPFQEMSVYIQVGVHYDSDLEKVERVTKEVGREILKTVPGAVPNFEPLVRFHTFSDFSINLTVILRAKEFMANYLMKHEFIKKLHKRYAREGINIPYPIRAINYTQEKSVLPITQSPEMAKEDNQATSPAKPEQPGIPSDSISQKEDDLGADQNMDTGDAS